MEGGFEAPILVTKRLVPSAEAATQDQGSRSFPGAACSHVFPASVEVKTGCDGESTVSDAPSAEEATNVSSPKRVSIGVHVAPELVEVQIDWPLAPLLTATILPPSAEEAIEYQKLVGALVWTQDWAKRNGCPPQNRTTTRVMSTGRMRGFITVSCPKI